MLIKDMFSKPIDRDIKGVVKVGQDDADFMKQELEEYVVTKELQKHFRDFFSNYKRGINAHTDKIGVWIAGFFGSGKSHFLKILSYLLENRMVDGKKAIDYFLDDEKINDSMVVADMKLASSVPTDVILFNIDSESETSGQKGKDSILNVFLKVFNNKLGYSTNPYLADLERQLTEVGLYEKFKDTYKDISGEEWVDSRHKFNFFKDRVIDSLVEIEFMSKEAASDWTRSTIEPYKISIIQFAKMVNDYLDSQGEDHHIAFLVDEMGQYIGDNTDLMLNLQTITEDLGTLCQGRAWIVVTSQQDIDSITEVVGKDFSKIQGRFDTRLSLTSANVDEVIKLRILEKNETANQTLSVLFENKETIIRNLIIFNDAAEKKLYENKSNFCEVYPFIPYQFNILGSVLTSIRKHGASGKHLAEGERSMLALFKESAEELKNCEDGAIVPFSQFYSGLNRFLDHSHSIVISKARDNTIINPDGEEENFNVNVLKTLFMIKYVKEIEANLENITTLMVSNIDEDRILLKEKVKEALDILVAQTLVQKNGDIYIFLTDEEQELNREIENQEVETREVIEKVSEIIFAEIYFQDKISPSGLDNRYSFGFNRMVDDVSYRTSQKFDFGVEVITPYSELNGQDSNLRMASTAESNVLVDLPNDAEFLKELKLSMQIEKFLSSSSSSNIPKFEDIRGIKRREMAQHRERAKIFLEDALKTSKFYLNGDLMELKSNDFKYKLTESLSRLVDTVYHKLNYISHSMDKADIYNLFKEREDSQINMGTGIKPNENAIREVLDYVRRRTSTHTKISLKEVKNRFTMPPFGFLDLDIEWIIAKCFIDGQIGLTVHGKTVSLFNQNAEKIIDFITKKSYVEKLLIEEKEIIPDIMKRTLKLVSKEVFKSTIVSEDTDNMVIQFNNSAKGMVNELNRRLEDYRRNNYPGQSTIKEGKKLIEYTINMDNSKDVFEYVRENEADYLDFSEDYPRIKSFLEGNQKEIWDKTQRYLKIYKESKSYIVNEEIEGIVDKMEDILRMSEPYNRISDLPELNKKFNDIYLKIFDEQLEPVKRRINQEKERIVETLEETGLEEKFSSKFTKEFNQLEMRADNCDSIAQVNGFKLEAETLKKRFLKEINEEIERLKREAEEKTGEDDGTSVTVGPVKPVKKRKSINIKDINLSNTWRIESKEDLDKHIARLRREIEGKIEEDTILNIEF